MFWGLDPVACCLTLLFSGIAGTVAGRLIRGKGYGPIADIVLGLVGGAVGSMLFRLLGFRLNNLCADFIAAVIGAVLLVGAVRLLLNTEFAR